ncbi:MAG TPA: glycosyltransferase family 39 protein [Candidatus Thermoplasmatota archaeon]|nr:glycosyltransferase family 39 protein [Candidatus Thermoplasmatota archaeon]
MDGVRTALALLALPDPGDALAVVLVAVALAPLLMVVLAGLTHHTRWTGHLEVVLAVTTAVAGGLVALLVVLLEGARPLGVHGSLARWEEWYLPLLDRVDPGMQEVARLVAAATSLYPLVAAFLALFAYLAVAHRWRGAYATLFLGPGAVGLLFTLKWLVPREPPGQELAFLPFSSFPNDTAALLPVLLVALAWMRFHALPSRRQAVSWALPAFLAALAIAAPLAAGTAWPSDVLGGLMLAVAWSGLCLLGLRVLQRAKDPEPRSTGPAPPHRLVALRQAANRFLERLFASPRPFLALIALGAALRIASLWTYDLGIDANRYAAMGWSFAQDGTFTMPWGDVYSPGAAAPSHHYPPLYPAFLAAFFSAFGFSETSVHLAAVVGGLLAIATTYLCTRDLYGHAKALAATAAVAVSPVLVHSTSRGYSEDLVLALFVATLWAILKSLERPAFMVAAGVFAALGYLAKSSMGLFFIIAGLGGLAWRTYWKGWRVLKDPPYLAAIVLFGATVVAWGWRNWSLFGSWETSAHLSAAYQHAAHEPVAWLLRSLLTFLFLFGVGYLAFLGLLPWLPRLRSIPRLASEHDSGLWLAIGLPLLLTALIDSALWLYEGEFFFFNVRYVSFVIVPSVWLVMRHASLRDAGVRAATAASLLILVLGSIAYAIPNHPAAPRLANDLRDVVGDGDTVAFVGTQDVYRYYFDATDDGRRDVHAEVVEDRDVANLTARWVVVKGQPPDLPAAYVEVAREGPQEGPVAAWSLWRRDSP